MFERDSSEMTSNEKAPSFEDICMKDARTLNTNVQLLEEAAQISTDSEKFHKPLNINRNEITEVAWFSFVKLVLLLFNAESRFRPRKRAMRHWRVAVICTITLMVSCLNCHLN